MKDNQLLGRLSSFFYKITRLWLVGLFLILIVSLFIALPVFEDILQMEKNMTSLDSSHINSSDRVYEILTEWGESGRLKQLWLHLTWDLLFPLIYFFFLGFLITWLSKRGFKQQSKMQLLNLVSLVAVVDILENISLFLLIFVFPANVSVLCWIKTGLTFTKYYLFGPALLFVLVVSTIFAIKNRFAIQK